MSYTRGHHKQGSTSRGGGGGGGSSKRSSEGGGGASGGGDRGGSRGGGRNDRRTSGRDGSGSGGTSSGATNNGSAGRALQHSPSAEEVEHMHDRLTYLLAKSVGATATVTVSSGDRYRGLFSAASTEGDLGIVLLEAEQLNLDENGGPAKTGPTNSEVIEKLVVLPRDVVEINIQNPDLSADQKSEFKTDTDISRQRGAIVERELQKWTPDNDDSLAFQSLEESAARDGRQWDQFAANKEKFGIESTYDEHFYTTAIDRSHPKFKERERRAERIASEIEKSTNFEGNVHMAEERGLAVEAGGLDEEDKYSGVDRRAQQLQQPRAPPAAPRAANTPGKYTPPQFRAPTGAKGTGAPHDPAIISAALATPDGRLTPRGGPAPSIPAAADANGKHGDKPRVATGHDIENELIGNFRQFVSGEVERLQQKKLSLQKKEMSERLNDFKKFSDNYKIKAPVPPDLVPLLGKGKDKQQLSPPPGGAGQPLVPVPANERNASPAPTVASEPSRVGSGTPAGAAVEKQTSETDLTQASASAKPKFNFNAHAFKPKIGAPSFVPGAPASVSPVPAVVPVPSAPAPLPATVATPQQAQTPTSPARANITRTAKPLEPSRSPTPATTFFTGNEPAAAKPRQGLFNPFTFAKSERKAGESFVIVKGWATAPTWAPATDDENATSYMDRYHGPGMLSPRGAADFYVGAGAGLAGFPASPMGGMVPVIPAAGFGDRNSPAMASPPPVPGQMMPAMIPGIGGYPQFVAVPAYNMQQFYSRVPQYPQIGMQMGGYVPQQGAYGSPRGMQAVMVPPGGAAGASPGGQYYLYPQSGQQQSYRAGGSGGSSKQPSGTQQPPHYQAQDQSRPGSSSGK